MTNLREVCVLDTDVFESSIQVLLDGFPDGKAIRPNYHGACVYVHAYVHMYVRACAHMC